MALNYLNAHLEKSFNGYRYIKFRFSTTPNKKTVSLDILFISPRPFSLNQKHVFLVISWEQSGEQSVHAYLSLKNRHLEFLEVKIQTSFGGLYLNRFDQIWIFGKVLIFPTQL